MTDTGEARWFKVVILVVSGFSTAIFVTNAVYYNRARTGTCPALTKNECTTLLWINVILAIISGLVFIWSLWRLLFGKETREKAVQSVVRYGRAPGTGLVPETYQRFIIPNTSTGDLL